eukprot:TRINITY_DN4710_c0_g1_i1.p1 TRINITY_DN4710_c0_g1~~TRINITY_DN4710_c0_g1_i1.p1  ORF type:complete len:321 (+),score=80.74 TRINITY_DN4710_c0_g1_i1:144-965(+)
MGVGIAQVAAQIAKLNVLLIDADKKKLDKSLSFMDSILEKNVAKGKMSADEKAQTMSRVKVASSYADFGSVDFAVEAVSENLDIKLAVFKSLVENTPAHAILASNTSSISITKIAAATKLPAQVIGMHFMNPVPIMKLVEIIPGIQTSEETKSKTLALAAAMGKTTTVSRDMPGFIANRILLPYINEACYALMEGIGSVEDIDTTMKLGTNVPMGPLTLADFIGLDTCLAIMQVLHRELGDSKYRPSPLLVKYVEAGWFGKKSGRGFYNYDQK